MENDYIITPACDYISTYVFDTERECSAGRPMYPTTGGQAFDTDHYNVLARAGCEPARYNIWSGSWVCLGERMAMRNDPGLVFLTYLL